MGRRKVTGSAKSGSLDSSPLTSIAVRIQPLWVFSLDGASTGGHQLDEVAVADLLPNRFAHLVGSRARRSSATSFFSSRISAISWVVLPCRTPPSTSA